MLDLKSKKIKDICDFDRFDIESWEELKEHITYKVVNSKMITDEEVIHQNYMDLSLVCILSELSKDKKSFVSYELKKSDIEDFDVTEEEVLEIAKENLSKKEIKRINTLKEDFLSKNMYYPILKLPREAAIGFSEDHSAIVEDSNNDHDNVVIVTNKYNTFGASYMLDTNAMREVFNRLKNDFYIIPTSVHQLMCVSEEYVKKRNKNIYETEDDLLDMLFRINSDNKQSEDILTYRIYKYMASEGGILFSIKQKN